MSGAALVRRRFPLVAAAWIAAFVVILVACARRLDLDLTFLSDARSLDAARETFGRMWPPATDAATLEKVWDGVRTTVAMSLAGTLLGAIGGLLLMPLCCETLFLRGPLVDEEGRRPWTTAVALALHHAARLVSNVFRTVPYFVWAVLFFFMVRPGPFPGTLAISVHTAGVISRNYAQALDQTDSRPQAALRSAGARRSHVFLFAMLPSARTALAALTLYRWDVNIRESTVLGLVGAGGLGFHLNYAISIRDWNAAGTHLLAIMVLVVLVDALSTWLRKRMR
jgi:phosphonate transport system permease protein